MKTLYIALLSGVLAIASAAVNAQEPTRVRGTIAAIDGDCTVREIQQWQ